MPVHRHPIANSRGITPLTGLPIDGVLVVRLRSTYEHVRAHDLLFAEIFYARLFKAAPHLRSMFAVDLVTQTRKLTAALDAVVANLENPAANTSQLIQLGKRHAEYGARPEHYDLVIDLLIESMREVLGPTVAPTALDEWRMALRLISDHMIAAAGR